MNIAVLGANGRTGQVFIEAALASGHHLRAGIRGHSRLPHHSHLTIVHCDAANEKDLRSLIEGQDAVVSLIGHVKGSPPDVQTQTMRDLVKIMSKQEPKRLVSLTGTGVRFPGDKITLIDRFLNLGVGLVDPGRVKDGRDHVKVLQESKLDWTVIRVLKLQNVAPRDFLLSEDGPTKPIVSRKEVAQAIIQVLEDNSFIKQAPIIGWPK